MSWRTIQLGNTKCKQDHVILDLFNNQAVNYCGDVDEFSHFLSVDSASENLILIINHPVWTSDLRNLIKDYLSSNAIKYFYISVNRYQLLGNDLKEYDSINSEIVGLNIVNILSDFVVNHKYSVLQSGYFDNDQGKYFNFVQPLTWIYGTITY